MGGTYEIETEDDVRGEPFGFTRRTAYRIGRFAYKAFKRALPENRHTDKLIAFLTFVRVHKRLPSDALMFNDVLYRIKTSDEILNPLRVFVSDKEFVKLYVRSVVGDRYNVPTLGVIRCPEDVESFPFPADCCIKPTHASGYMVMRQDNAPIDTRAIKSWFKVNYYKVGREANYKALHPKVIVEPILFDDPCIQDYKIFCYNGRPRLIQVDTDRYTDHKRNFFDADWNDLGYSTIFPRATKPFPKPANLDEMLDVAARLSAAFSFIRVDLYSNGDCVFVGELTNISSNVLGYFRPREAEYDASSVLFGPDQAPPVSAG